MASEAQSSHSSDVIVVGGGLIGCSIALRLAQKGLRVSVFERGEPGSEASSAGAGMIAPQGETVEPGEFFEFCAASRDLYPGFVAEVEGISGQRVGFRQDGTLLAAFSERQCRELEAICQGQTRAGLRLERLTGAEARRRVPQLSRRLLSAMFIAGDYWLDNEVLATALHEACRRSRVTFHTHTQVVRFNACDDRVQSIEACAVSGSSPACYSAAKFVLAAGAWSGEIAASLGVSLPVTPCRGQMIEFDGAPDLPMAVRSGPHYLVPRTAGRIIAGSTMEYVGYEKAVTGEGLRSILEGAQRLAPFVKHLRFRRAWAGLRPDTKDHRPILGYGGAENLVFATGHFRNGILLTPVTAQVISRLILTGSTSRWIEAYNPARFRKSEMRE